MQDYELVARLGRGGMGVVDLARDRQGNRVAMKRLTLHGSANDIMRARQRLLREAEVLRRLQHPNIVRLLDVVEEDDEIVLIMPYLNGGNLAERVGQHGPAPPGEVERLAQRLLGALATAHAKGIIHRDIKPANVLFDEHGEPCLADFGVAHTWDQTGGLTVAGMVVGTPGFMAPEQARDEQLTPASDVFALGATLLYAATGIGPYGSGDPALLMVRAADGKVERIPKSVPPRLRRRLRTMLDPRPERRPTAAALLTEDLSALRRPPARYQIGAAARPVGVAAGRARSSLTGPAVAFAAFAGVVMVVALGVSVSRDDDSDTAGSVPPTGQSGDQPSGDGAPGEGPAMTIPDDAGAVAEDPEDGRPLVDELQGTVGPGDPDDILALPMGEIERCPEDVQLAVGTAPLSDLVVEVLEGAPGGVATPVGIEGATEDGQTVLTFHPPACGDGDRRLWVRLVAVGEPTAAINYLIRREDS